MVHIRKKLRKLGGNQFYKDNSIRKAETLCGAEVTDRDVDFKTGGTKSFKKWAIRDRFVCEECLKLRMKG